MGVSGPSLLIESTDSMMYIAMVRQSHSIYMLFYCKFTLVLIALTTALQDIAMLTARRRDRVNSESSRERLGYSLSVNVTD